MLEIEIKARIHNPDGLKALLTRDFEFIGSQVKKDRYYCEAGSEQSCQPETHKIARLRVDGPKTCLTVKRKKVEEGVEINEEFEVDVDNFDDAEQVLSALGFAPFLNKEKRTDLYQDPKGAKLEFNEIKGLGFFLEIEELLDDSSGREEIEACKSRLKDRLVTLGLSNQDVESRPYMALLRDQQRGSDA